MTKSTLGISKPLLATSVANKIGTDPDLNLKIPILVSQHKQSVLLRSKGDWEKKSQGCSKTSIKILPNTLVKMLRNLDGLQKNPKLGNL